MSGGAWGIVHPNDHPVAPGLPAKVLQRNSGRQFGKDFRRQALLLLPIGFDTSDQFANLPLARVGSGRKMVASRCTRTISCRQDKVAWPKGGKRQRNFGIEIPPMAQQRPPGHAHAWQQGKPFADLEPHSSMSGVAIEG
jgi:hypothetical protein